MIRTFFSLGALFVCLLYSATALAQTANRTEGCPPLLVNFDPPTGQSSFFWTFGNGATSIDARPSTTFTEEGTYVVELRENAGGTVVGTVTINVYPQPILMATPSLTQGCAPLAVAFEQTGDIDPGISINGLRWVFGDGNFSTAAQPTHVYNRPGNYDVSLSLQSDLPGCSVTEIFPELVTVGGVERLNFFTSPNPPVSCTAPLTVNFVNLSTAPGLSFSWDLGNGDIFDGITPGPVTYTEGGSFRVELTAEDTLGCTNTTSQTIFILDLAASLNVPDTICLGEPVYFNEFVDQADSVRWQFPSTSVRARDELGIEFVRFLEPGVQEIQLSSFVDAPISCQLDTIIEVFVEELEMTLTSGPSSFTCEKELTIDFTAGGIPGGFYIWRYDEQMEADTGIQVQHTYEYVDTLEFSENGLIPYFTVLIGQAPSGCKDTIVQIDTIYAPNALFMADVVRGCAPLTVTFADSSSSFSPITQYVYDYGDGTGATFTTDADHQHTYSEAGEYPVTLHILNESGCRDTSYTRIIEVGGPLDTDFDLLDNSFCPGDSLGFVIDSSLPDADWIQFELPNILHIEYNGCFSSVINEEIEDLGPRASIIYEIDCESPYDVQFDSELYNVGTISWDFGDGTGATTADPAHRYTERGDYLVKLTVDHPDGSCPPFTDSLLICIRDIQADFDLPDAICAGTELNIDASSTRDVNGEFCAYGFTWFFDLNGRPIMGNDTILPKTFNTPGRERVTLVAKDINGCRDTLVKPMNIYSITPELSASDNFICMPATVDFMDNSTADTTLVNWTWDFGDGNMASGPDVTHTYNTLGPDQDVNVILTLEDAQGCQTVDTLLLRTYIPVSNLVVGTNNPNICVGDSLSFYGTPFTTGGSTLSYTWQFDSEPPFVADTVGRTYAMSGQYNLTMTFTEVATGCTDERSIDIDVEDYPEASFITSVDNDPVICAPAQIDFTSTTQSPENVTTRWQFGNGGAGTGPTASTAFNRGSYTITMLSTTPNGCTDEAMQDIEVVGPVGSFIADATAICQGETVTFTLLDTMDISSYTWDFGDGFILDDVNPAVHTYENLPPSGTLPVTLILRSENDLCEFSVTRNLSVNTLTADFALSLSGETTLCADTYSLINLTDDADTYLWTFPDGETSTEETPSIDFAVGENVLITLRATDVASGCFDEISKRFTFLGIDSLLVMGDTICVGDTAQLVVQDTLLDWQYVWLPTTGFIDPANIATPRTLVAETTTYGVTVTDADGCQGAATAAVVVVDPPEALLDVDEVACPGDTLQIMLPEVELPYVLTWSPVEPPLVIGEEDIDLTFTISDLAGCYEDEYTFFVNSVSDSLILPQLFSPNGDNVNDEFRLFTEMDQSDPDQLFIEEFKVFNRWGQLVFEGGGTNVVWDGQVNGKPAPADVYIYEIRADIRKSQRKQEFIGQVTLVR